MIYVTETIRTIKDPEKPSTLEDLNVVYEEGIEVNIIEKMHLFKMFISKHIML
jgi:hypothetical protein